MQTKANIILYMVIPCYNEQDVLRETADRLKKKFLDLSAQGVISTKSRIVFVNDGSKDRTWETIRELHSQEAMFEGINLSRNRGHQNALLSGLMTVRKYAEVIISMDADLQDDIEAIDQMLEKYQGGYDVVYGVRNKRATDTVFKRVTAQAFYKFIQWLGADVIDNHADFRLMSKRAVDGLAEFKEVNLFLRGLIPLVGFPATVVYYERASRFAGESKYPFKKMLFFALQGITSLTVEPIRLIIKAGFLISVASVLMMAWILMRYVTGHTTIGWSSTLMSIWFLGGLVLLSIGVVGEYIGKIYLETKHRPRYIIQDLLRSDDNSR